MRLCRYQHNGHAEVAIYEDNRIISLNRLAQELMIELPTAMSGNILDYLPPDGKSAASAEKVYERFKKLSAADQTRLSRPMAEAKLRVPVPEPKKIILLAGNYNEHIQESGGLAVIRDETFPYFFWKPPSTTLTNPNDPVKIPTVSPNHVDWELELGVIIGKACKNVTEKEALKYVAGYTVCNDISDRKFTINPKRKPRDKDGYFDWLHGKWHDTFLPVGPCVTSAASIPDPQKLPMKLKVNGQVMQNASTASMIFPVAAIVSILSSFTNLEPGDLIVTGTPSGVGHARKPPIYLKAGDVMEAEIAEIGMLRNPVV